MGSEANLDPKRVIRGIHVIKRYKKLRFEIKENWNFDLKPNKIWYLDPKYYCWHLFSSFNQC